MRKRCTEVKQETNGKEGDWGLIDLTCFLFDLACRCLSNTHTQNKKHQKTASYAAQSILLHPPIQSKPALQMHTVKLKPFYNYYYMEACVAEQLTPQTQDVEIQGLKPCLLYSFLRQGTLLYFVYLHPGGTNWQHSAKG